MPFGFPIVVKIAVAGCGALARHVHLPLLARLGGVDVVAVIDPEPSSREAARRIWPRARPLAKLADLWNLVELDAVIVSAPTAHHAALATEALQHRKHVYLEKPLATSLAEADTILAASRDSGVVGMIGFNYRFHRLFVAARRRLAQNAIGAPLMGSTVFATSIAGQGWRGDRSRGGGVLPDLGSHHVDLIQFLLGESVMAVSAQTSSAHSEAGTATLQLRLESGLLVNSCFSFGTVDQDRLEIFGERGLLRVDRNLSSDCEIIPANRQRARWRQFVAAVSFAGRPNEILSKLRTPGNELSYRAALAAFIAAVRTGMPAKPDFGDGYRALAVISAAQRSAQNGVWVDVTPVKGLA